MATPSAVAPARATTRKRFAPAPYRATKLPTARELHMMSRFGYGFSPTLFKQMRRAGGEVAWFHQQLDPGAVAESTTALQVPSWFPRLEDDPATMWRNIKSRSYEGWQYGRDLSNQALLMRIYSHRTVYESMVEFWSNHLHIDAAMMPAWYQRPAYDRTIRAHALGRFEDLLVAATLHPAMLLYLDTWRSTREKPNENHARELLELHTLGLGNYDEAMIKDVARILSGHTVREEVWTSYFDPERHALGPVSVIGFSVANAVADAPGLAESFLRVLAHHPATARMIARKLAVRFVADDPSPQLVERLAATYLASGTSIKATLKALVDSPEFWATPGGKVRTPADDLVATVKARRVKVKAPTSVDSFAHELSWTLNSQLVYQWPRPDGPPDRADVWGTTSRVLNSWQMHWGIAGGWWPNGQARYPAPKKFLPQKRIRFDKLVDHLSRSTLGRPATSTLLKAACQACDVKPREKITKKHPVIKWKFNRLLAVLLDSPAHMTR